MRIIGGALSLLSIGMRDGDCHLSTIVLSVIGHVKMFVHPRDNAMMIGGVA
jgi:hypothetical protein